jgi:superfamily II RNA helicase
VLKQLKYIDDLNQPLIKARVAKEIGENELFLCEIIVENVLQDLNYVEIASLLSGFVNQFKPRKVKYEHTLQEIEHDVDEVWSDNFKASARIIYNISK